MLDVRHVGYSAAETPVELRSGSIVTRDVRLPRIANLDSIRVVATRQRYTEFSDAQKHSLGAIFLGPEEMEQRQRVAAYTSDVLRRLSGFAVVGVGSNAKLVSNRGPYSGCRVPIVIDGNVSSFSINDIAAAHIGAMAVYRAGDMGPSQFIGTCGAILIWTKR